jgi:hypothetical protein
MEKGWILGEKSIPQNSIGVKGDHQFPIKF